MITGATQLLRNCRLLAGIACWLGFAATAWWVESGGSAEFDRAGLLFWRHGPSLTPIGPEWLTQLMLATTTAGESAFRYGAVVIAIGALTLRGHRNVAGWLFITVFAAAAVESGMKVLFARERPSVVPWLDDWSGNAFPSGHAFNATVVYLALALIFSPPDRRAAAVAAAIVFSLAIALSRVWLGVHWPSDAIAGWLGGAGWLLLASLKRR